MALYVNDSGERKNIIIDTSVLISFPESINKFDGQNVYLPIEVLEEIDALKVKSDQVGSAARTINRFLDNLRDDGSSLFNGVKLENGQVIKIIFNNFEEKLPPGFEFKNDNKIISCAYGLSKSANETILLSKDIALRVKADAVGLVALDCDKESFGGEKDSESSINYNGFVTIEVPPEDIDQFYVDEFLKNIEGVVLKINQGVILKSGKSSALAIAYSKNSVKKPEFYTGKSFKLEGLSARSKEQILAIEYLLDPDIHLVTMTGPAGAGKTLLSIAAALNHLQNNVYKKLVLSRPLQSTSKDIGFLPGSKAEKLSPWLQPFFDNMEFLLGEKGHTYLEMMMEKKKIEMEALTYIRGRTLAKTMFIVDEAQNITHEEAKAIITRMGEGSKLVLIGDLEQIDSHKLDEETSGLATVINLFKDFDRAAHVKMNKGERSELATYATKVM